jgi:hypothetical protein
LTSETTDAKQAHIDGAIFIHGLGNAQRQRIHLDASNIESVTVTSKFSNLKKLIDKGKGRRTLVSNLDQCLRNIDIVNLKSECLTFFSSFTGSGSIDVVLDLTSSEFGTDPVNTAIMSSLKELAIEKNIFNITPLILVSPQTDWDSNTAIAALELSNAVGSPVFIISDKENERVYGIDYAITLNLPHLSLTAKNEPTFFEDIQKNVDIAVHAQGEKEGAPTAICLLGGDEAVRNLVGKGIENSRGKAVAYKILEVTRTRINELSKEENRKIFLETCPDASTSAILAEIDLKQFPEAAHKGVNQPFYTQSTQLPAGYTDDLYDALEHQRKLQSFYDYGVVFPIHIAAPLPEPDMAKVLLSRIFKRFTTPAIAIAPRFKACKNHGLKAQGLNCPVCGGDLEFYGWGWSGIKTIKDMSVAEKEWNICKPYAVKSE